jgi:hypothetical protein
MEQMRLSGIKHMKSGAPQPYGGLCMCPGLTDSWRAGVYQPFGRASRGTRPACGGGGATEARAPGRRSHSLRRACSDTFVPQDDTHEGHAFDILYLTLGASAIVNVDDGSDSLLPEVQYKPTENLELRWVANIQRGGPRTEFGEK